MKVTRETIEGLRRKIRELKGVTVIEDNRPKGCGVGDMLNNVFGKLKEEEEITTKRRKGR